MAKIGIDFGNKTFTVMRIENDEIELVPNLHSGQFGETGEALPAIFAYENGKWSISSEQNEFCMTELLKDPDKMHVLNEGDQEITLSNKDGLIGALRHIKEMIEINDGGMPITEAIFAIPNDYPELANQFVSAMKKSGWPIREKEDAIDESVAALFGSGLFDDLKNHIGESRTVLVLDGRTNELNANIYTVTIIEKETGSIHFDLHLLSGHKYEKLGGKELERMMAAQLKKILDEQGGGLQTDQFEEREWFNLVDYVKNEFHGDSELYMAYNYSFSDGTLWEQPESINHQDLYAVFRGETSYINEKGETNIRNIETELHTFLYDLCDEGGINTDQIEHIVMAGGTFQLPFWREAVQAVLPSADLVTPPDGLSHVAITGRGCAQLIKWRENYQITFSERKKTGNYIGIGYFYNDVELMLEPSESIFKPLVVIGQGQTEKSATNLFEIPNDFPLVLHVYRGPQTDELYKCEKMTTLRFLHTALKKQVNSDHIGVRFIVNSNDQIFYEVTHPYTDDIVEKGEIVL